VSRVRPRGILPARVFQELLALAQDPVALKSLLSVVRDATQLKRILLLMATNPYADAAPLLKYFLTRIGNPADVELLINEAGLGPPPDPDAYRLARVLDSMGSGRKTIADVRTALNEQKDFDNKILYGRQKDSSKLTGDGRTIIGAHSPRILAHPTFQILSQSLNADGTNGVECRKLLSQGPTPVWSRNKTSTLAPPSWSNNDIFHAGEEAAKTDPVFVRARDGATLHRTSINGVQWEVIMQGTVMTSSYPTGGVPSTGI